VLSRPVPLWKGVTNRQAKVSLDLTFNLQGDWEEFDRVVGSAADSRPGGIMSDQGFDDATGHPTAAYSGALQSPAVNPPIRKLPNITVVPNLSTRDGATFVLGCTMGHFHTPERAGRRVMEVYEFQSYGLMILDDLGGHIDMWVLGDGDKVAVPGGCQATLYNLGDQDHPLVTLDFADPSNNPFDRRLAARIGPILLAYYNDVEVAFTLNLQHINNPFLEAGVRLSVLPFKSSPSSI
jgi:hypothetical protein